MTETRIIWTVYNVMVLAEVKEEARVSMTIGKELVEVLPKEMARDPATGAQRGPSSLVQDLIKENGDLMLAVGRDHRPRGHLGKGCQVQGAYSWQRY